MADADDSDDGSNTSQPTYGLKDFQDDVSAGERAAVDAGLLGIPNQIGAIGSATLDALQGKNWMDGYQSVRTQQAAQDAYDAAHHAIARRIGQGIGIGMGLLVSDGLTAAPAATARIAFTAPTLEPTVASVVRYMRPPAAAAGAGAIASIAGQGIHDAATGHLGSPQTYASDVIGGAAGGLGTFARSPTLGAIADSIASGATYSALTGHPISPDDMARNALFGSYWGVGGHLAGANVTNRMDRQDKGRLGEFMAKRTSNVLGDKIDTEADRTFKVSGGKTIVDHVSSAGPVEAKFGYRANLSKRQTEASREIPNYNIYHFLPEDAGRLSGGLLGIPATQWNGNP